MFRIESYVTSIILSYVDRYIKNFKRQDAQVSLWEGDGSLHNLDLDLEVLDQELNLPFSFVSGHIHELLIHVPWTRIASEPVKITINTIECIMKLKPPGQENVAKKDKKKKTQTGDECVAPPSYMSSLVSKIIFNLSVTCNNLILKYVEEDIVLSMNIKTLSLSTVNKQWVPEFSELSAVQLILRNLVNLSDVTICLDKRNASGRIEAYMEPILYKCSLTIRISRSFPSPGCTVASTTRIGIKCDNFALSISQPQVPMLIRLVMLVKSILNSPPLSNATSQMTLDNDDSSMTSDGEGQYESWSSWVWGFVPSILPAGDDSEMSNANENLKALHFGLYVSNCVLDMKLVEEGKTWQSLGKIQLEDLFLEMSKNNNDWTNVQLGICVLSVSPAPQFDNEQYVACGRPNQDLMIMSLFENPDTDFPQRPWDVHMSSVTENDMVNRAPALAMDSLSVVEVLPENWTDNFQTESRQKALTRFVCGPLDINVTTGLLDRIRVIVDSIASYDYPMPAPSSSGGPANDFAPVKDKYFNDSYIPKEITQFTMCEACIRVYAAQIPLPGKKTKKNLNTELIKTYSTKQQPHLLLKVKCLDVNLTRPLNPDMLQGLVLRNPPMEMFSEAMTTLSAGIMKVSASVLVGDTEVIDVLEASKISTTMAFDSILQIEPDSISCHRRLQIGELSVSTSKSKLLLAINIVESYLIEDLKSNPIYNSSLVQDSMNFIGVPFLKFTLSGFHFMFVRSQVNESYKVRLGSLSGQTFYYGDNKARPKFTILTAGSSVSKNIFEGIAQRPLSDLNTAPFLFYVKLKQLHVNLEQSLVDWILYKPKKISTFRASRLGSGSASRKISSSSLSSFSKKPATVENVESLEKIIEKETSSDPPLSTTIEDYEKTEKWISLWLSLIVSADITDVAFTYSTASTENYSIVFKIPSISASTNYGKLAADCDELPVIFNAWVKNTTSFPWSVDINGISAYSVKNASQTKQTVLEPFSVNCTIAVTSKFTPNPTVAVTIHTDTSSINIAASHHEISALMDLMMCTSLVMTSLTPPKRPRKFDELPIDLNLSSDESCSRSRSQSLPVNQSESKSSSDTGSLKVSCWLQWTMAKMTLSLYTSSTSVTGIDDLKLGAEFEDIIISSDMDINARVYQKLKMKIGSASIKYYSREFKHFPWKLGSFGGVVMRGHELSDNNSQFLSLTLTRVLASHYHSKLSNITHQIKESVRQRTTPTDRYVMEIDLKLEPLDFVLSPQVLGKFVRLYEPIINRRTPDLAPLAAHSAPLDQFTTADLPLVYLDIEQIRVFLPSSTLQSEKSYDTIIIVIDDVALRHEAVNPVTRKILRSDIYSSAQRARVTALPGSQLEDRQYQLDFTLHVSTGVWDELSPHVRGEQSTGPDNPAVYWNSVRGHAQHGAGLTPLVSPPVKICLILAPPIVTSGFVVSGLNFEVNVISEMSISLCLEQIRLINHLLIESKSILPDSSSDPTDYSVVDSGLESADSSIVTPVSKPKLERVYRRANSSLISVSSSTPVNTKNLRQKIHTVPRDILFIAKAITLKLYSKDVRNSRTQPLLYFLIAQPFVSLEKHGDTCVHKASIFDLTTKIGTSEHFSTSSRLDADDFVEPVLVTREGDPDPYKGIPPAVFSCKMTQVGMKLPVVDVEISRPLKLSAKISNVKFLESVQLLFLDALEVSDYGNTSRLERGDVQKRLDTIKESRKFPQFFSSISLSSKQLAFEFQQSSPGKRSVILSLSSMSSVSNFPSPNQIYGTLNVTALILSVISNRSSSGPRPLINPWTLSLTGNLIREPWIASPLLTVQLSSDILELEYSPRRVDILRDVVEELKLTIEQRRRASSLGISDEEASSKESNNKTDEEDQFYKDDLQAGAFQFVNSDPPPELPLAYQVIFPSHQVMAWAYPQPRCITSITVLPVPFRNSELEEVDVSLQYLDFLGWKDWITFSVSESEIAEVELTPKPRVASTWRVVIKSPHSPIDAHALAASLRVDSMFSGSLVPNLRFNLSLDCFQVSVWAGPTRVITLPPPLTRFALENPIPGEYPFAKASVEHIKLRLLSWRCGSLEIEGDLRGRVDVVNCRTLQEQCCVQPFPVHVNFESDPKSRSLSLIAGPILVYAAPSTSHTLVTALNDALLMAIVICNDTCYPVRIGQAGTCEDITIQCLQCHFYSWRTVQQGTELRFSVVSQDDKHWSHPIQVAKEGNFPVQLIDDSGRRMTVVVIVKKLSSTMTQILISGELVVYNNLEKSVDMRLVSSSIAERQRYITVNPCGRAPSVLLCPDVKYSIRLSLEAQWSGLVPLHSTSNSWLVKIPSRDKKDFTSVWCQIFQDKDSKNKRTLIVISPMYLIKSMLPCNANVLVKTEELNVARSLKVPGRGAISNLLTPGTTTHNHSLTFHIDGNLPSSSPHVPLSYSAMDGKTPPPPAIPDTESLIDRTEMVANEASWPFLETQWGKTVWGYANQPDTITHVKVKFCADRLQVANSLMVELQPWALVVNTLGLGIALQSSERFLCALQHSCVLAPPPIEGTFYLLVELNDGYHKSNSLQLSDSHSFYKPQISGLIPLTDSVRVKVQAPNSVIYATIHSKVALGGVRVLHISSSFVISNLSDFDLRVAAFSVRRDNCKFRVPSEVLSFTIILPKNTSDFFSGEPLAEWHEIGYGPESSRRLYLIFERDGLVSNPIPVDTKSERGVQTALLPVVSSYISPSLVSPNAPAAMTSSTINVCLEVVFQAKDGVTYVSVDRQMCPQLIVHNRTRQLLAVAKSAKEQGGCAVDESEDWEWRFMLPGGTCGHYKIELEAASSPLPPLVVSKPEYNGWSSPISLVPSAGARLVSLPHSSDLMASVVRVGYTVHLVLVYANHSLISAGDVRCRLSISSQHELPRINESEQPQEVSEVKQDDETTCEDLEDLKKSAFSNMKVTCFLRGLTVMLCAEPDCSFHWQEVTALTVDNVAVTVQPTTNPDSNVNELEARITVWDLQIDNQEFQKGGYDFSVVLLRQGELDRSVFLGSHHRPEALVQAARESDPAIDMTLLLNTNVRPALQEVSLEVAPLQIYIEDTYLTNLTNHLSKMIPTMLITGGKNLKIKEASPSKSDTNARMEEEFEDEKVIKIDPSNEEDELMINVSDSEEYGDTPLSLSPWKEAHSQASSSRRRRGRPDDNTTESADGDEFTWMDDTADFSATALSSNTSVPIPEDIIRGSQDLLRPLRLKKFLIAPLRVLVSLHTSTKFYIALDQSPLSFSEFKRVDMVTTPYRLGHALTLHYFLGAIYGTGWALGSLQLLGAPAGLARSVGHGLRSFLVLPYRGIMEGPTGFLLGVIHGSASLMKHVTAGTLTSVNKLAGSWSRTLDRLTLNAEDLKFAEEMRRNKPQGLAEGLRQGFTEFGVSLLGGVGGLAQQPLEYAAGTSSQSLVSSLGRGLVGVMARPISGAAELVALTAHGILSGAGWADTHLPKHQAICQGVHQGAESRIKYKLKLVPKGETLLFVCEASSIQYEPVVLVVTSFALYILNRDDVIIHQVKLQDLSWAKDKFDPTSVKITVQTPDSIAERLTQKRISEFVRDSQRALSSVSPDTSNPPSPPHSVDQEPLKFYLNPQRRDHFITLLDLAARHAAGKGFATFF